MLFKLSLRNLSHSIRDYAVYFITLILGVMVFYLFNALDSQSVLAMVGSSSYEIIHQMMAFLYLMSFFVAFIMGFLVIYALLAQRDASLTGQERDDPAKEFVAVPDRLSHRRGHARLCIL